MAEQLREIDALGKIILEPFGRNTAPAIALAALLEKDNNPLLLVLAADHVVADQASFTEAVLKAVPLAEAGKLVTFGILPTEPRIGYGYIKAATSNVSLDLDFVRVDGEAFESCPSDSIDYAVMEKTNETVVMPLDAGWNDIGSWSSLWDISKKR